jgi:phosphoribosylformimino-5-aminoimidazole carboxamide ribotide isomerase
MKIFPVLDLMKGIVVRGVAGQRESYQPVQSVLTKSHDPLEVAEAFQTQLDLNAFYVADLDAILFGQPQLSILHQLAAAYPGLWLDCGIRSPMDIPGPLETQDVKFVLGLETIQGPRTLRELCKNLGPERIVFSLDLKAGLPLGNLDTWISPSPGEIAQEAIDSGLKNLIVLDLAQVGVGAGVSTLPLCRRIKESDPGIQVVTGGGIRHVEDLISLEQSQIDGALIASALHDGGISPPELRIFRQ